MWTSLHWLLRYIILVHILHKHFTCMYIYVCIMCNIHVHLRIHVHVYIHVYMYIYTQSFFIRQMLLLILMVEYLRQTSQRF